MSTNISLLQRARLFIVLLVFLLGLPAVVAGSWLIYQGSLDDRMEMLSERAPLVVQLLENDIMGKKQSLYNASTLLNIDQIDEMTQLQLDGIAEGFSGVIWAGVTDKKGKVLLAYKDLLKGADVSKRPWFKQGLEKESVLDRHDAVLLAGLLPKREDPYRFIDISVPIKSNKGETLGVLAMHLDWIWYQKQFPTLIGDAPASSLLGYVVFGKDNELRLLKASGETEALVVAADYSNGVTMKLQEHFYFVRHAGPEGGILDELDWTLYVLQSKQIVRQGVMSAAAFGSLAFLVGLFAAILLFYKLSNQVSRSSIEFVDALVNKDPEFLNRLRPKLPKEMLPLSAKAEALIAELNNQKQELEKALAEVRGNYMEIERLIAQAPVAIAMFDRQMNYLVCSNQWRSTYLPDVANPAGRCHYDLLPGIPEQWKQAHQQGMQGATLHAEDDCWVDAKGNKMWLNWTIQPWTTTDNKVGGLIIITEDVTETNEARLALARSEERFQLAMQGSHDGLWDWNMETGEIYFSPSWKTMLGYAPEELKDSFETWERLLHPEDVERARKNFMDAVQNGQTVHYSNTFRMAHRDGRWLSILSRGVILRNGNGVALRTVGTHLDRTDMLALQDQLGDARVMAQAEARANEAKSKFLATVSHEIRNPLNSVCGFARLIQDEVKEPELQRYAQLLGQTAGSLNVLLNDLLDLAKIDAGKLEICSEPFDIAALLDSMAEGGQLLCRDKNLGFEYSKRWVGDTGFVGDAGRVRQVVQNLLSNAIKFTQTGQVTLRVSTESESAGVQQIRIAVQDTGIGMTEESLNHLFKPFTQVHSDAQNQYGGTGLGLSIVKSLVEMMQGEVICDSVPGKGSQFTVLLRLSSCVLQRQVAVPAQAVAQRKILIADDSPINLKILSAFLIKRGHEVVCAANGNEAIEKLRSERFDYAILDMDMPGQNGLQVVSQIKLSGCPSADAVFACLSGHADQSTLDTALVKGFDRFFVKPVDWDEMLKFLQ